MVSERVLLGRSQSRLGCVPVRARVSGGIILCNHFDKVLSARLELRNREGMVITLIPLVRFASSTTAGSVCRLCRSVRGRLDRRRAGRPGDLPPQPAKPTRAAPTADHPTKPGGPRAAEVGRTAGKSRRARP